MVAKSVEPILAVQDICASVEYYEKTLGFSGGWTWGNPNHGGVRFGPVSLQFSLNPELAIRSKGSYFAIFTEDVDEWHAEHVKRGAQIVAPIRNEPWGVREYTIQDLNGYRIRIGGSPTHDGVSEPLPDGIRFELRVPTPEEFVAIQRADIEQARQLSHLSFTGVVAFLGDRPVAMARVVKEHPLWLSVWDVEVVEDLRGRHIGQAAMNALVEHLRANFSGAWLYLFTYKQGFYSTLGFHDGTVTMLKL